MKKKPKIICAGILNIKGDEIRFLAKAVERAGGEVAIMDLSLGKEVPWADIPLSEVLRTTNTRPEEVFAVDRSSAIEMVGKAGAKKIVQLHGEGKVDGIIAWSGSVGTSVCTYVMRALPIGVPKIMLSTLAAGDVSNWLGNKDIYIVNPISEKGINRVTRKIIANAAAAIVAMGGVGEISSKEDRPLVALTAYGTTTPTVMRCEKHMEESGWDTIIIHQVGTGATMEDLMRSKQITAVFDITTGELSNTRFHSIYGMPRAWDGERLTAASEMGIPQIVCPGGLDQCAFGPVETMPQKFLDDFKARRRVSYKNSGEPFVHNPAVSILPPTEDETRELAVEIITKLNKTKGPTALIVPMRGWSAYDQPADVATIERGWTQDRGDAPVWLPDPQNPARSKRAAIMCSVFSEKLDKSNPHLDFLMADMHILEEPFAQLLTTCMDDMLAGKWKKGMYRNLPGILG
jgi:uncharacterized protein (UPF0261 family)